MIKTSDGLIGSEYRFRSKDEARDMFTRLTGLYKNLNYTPEGSPQYADYERQIRTLPEASRAGVTAQPPQTIGAKHA